MPLSPQRFFLFRPEVVRIALPVLIEQTLLQTMGAINLMLSSRLGKETVAAIGMVDGLSQLFIQALTSLALGATVVVAHAQGSQDSARVHRVSRQALGLTLSVGLSLGLLLWLFRVPVLRWLYPGAEAVVLGYAVDYLGLTVLTYPMIAGVTVVTASLRGTGNTKAPAQVMVTMNLLAVVFSVVLIYGLGLGIQGAGLGLVLAWATALFLQLLSLRRHIPDPTRLPWWKALARFRFDPELLRHVVGIGLPAALESGLFSAGKLVSQTFIVTMGTASTAANSIGFSIMSLFVMPGQALGVAATTLVGQQLGRGDPEGARTMTSYLLFWGTLLVLVLSAAMSFFLAEPLAWLYTTDPEVVAIVRQVAGWMVWFTPVWGLSFLLPNALKGGGDTKYTLMVSMLSMWTVRVFLGYFLGITLGLGLLGIWLGMYTDWVLRAAGFGLRYRGNRWQRSLRP